jgi:hypothetical protein
LEFTMLACTLELVFVYREIAMIVYVCVCVSCAGTRNS